MEALPGVWEPSAHCWDINFCIQWIVSIEVSWPNGTLSFMRTQGLLDSPCSLAFQSLYCSPSPSHLSPSKEPLLLRKCLMGATIFFILLMWKWVNRSTQLAFPPYMLTWVPFVALRLYFILNCLSVWHATGVDGIACSMQLPHIRLYLGHDYLLTATLHSANVKWL